MADNLVRVQLEGADGDAMCTLMPKLFLAFFYFIFIFNFFCVLNQLNSRGFRFWGFIY